MTESEKKSLRKVEQEMAANLACQREAAKAKDLEEAVGESI